MAGLPASVRPASGSVPVAISLVRRRVAPSRRSAAALDWGSVDSASAVEAVTPPQCIPVFRADIEYVRQTLRRLGAERSQVDDLTQEAFLVLHRRSSEYDTARPLRPYLFGIALRLALAHQRKRYREVALGIGELGDDAPGPEDALCAKQAHALAQAALERVPEPRRAVLVMHEFDDVPVSAVASILSIPLFTVYSRLRKARREFEAAARSLMSRASERGSL
ncbi:MAG: sigma-70 family RNA polymerase sigma factor [Polyangiaceae bacterium]